MRFKRQNVQQKITAVTLASFDDRQNKRSRLVFLIIVFLLFWFVTYAYAYTYLLVPFKPLYSYILFTGLAAAIGLFSINTRFRLPLPYLETLKPFYLWFSLFIVYSVGLFVYGAQSEASAQVLISSIEVGGIGVAALYVFSISRSFPALLGVCAAAVTLGVVLVIYDFLNPFFSTVAGRGAGLYQNPNIAAKFLVILMIPAVIAIPRHLRLLFILGVGAAVVVTFSRGGWVIWAVGAGMLIYFRLVPISRNILVRFALVLAVALPSFYLLFSGMASEVLQDSALSQYLTSNTLGRLSGTFVDNSANERRAIIYTALEAWRAAPLFGHGLGYTLEWGHRVQPHNMYLLFMVEGGLVGLFMFLSLPVLLLRTKDKFAIIIALQLFLSSLFTHNNLGQPAMFVVLSLVIVMAARLRNGKRGLGTIT